jgi:hypothetical protein
MIEWRTIPCTDANAEVERLRAHLFRSVIPAMQAVDLRTGFAIEIFGTFPGMALDRGHPLTSLVTLLNPFIRREGICAALVASDDAPICTPSMSIMHREDKPPGDDAGLKAS